MANSVEEAYYDYLTADTTFTAKFESVDWIESTSTDYPKLVFFQVDDAGTQSYTARERQGEARIQHDIWDSSPARGVRLRSDVRAKAEDLNETRGGYTMTTISVTETTVSRENPEDPWHFVVDAIVRWHK